MPPEFVQPDPERRKRELRLRIARLRRRIDGHVRAVEQSGHRMLAWKTYVQAIPAGAVMASLGVGLVLSAGLSRRWLARWIGLRILRGGIERFGKVLWDEAAQIWKDSSPDTRRQGADDEQG